MKLKSDSFSCVSSPILWNTGWCDVVRDLTQFNHYFSVIHVFFFKLAFQNILTSVCSYVRMWVTIRDYSYNTFVHVQYFCRKCHYRYRTCKRKNLKIWPLQFIYSKQFLWPQNHHIFRQRIHCWSDLALFVLT